jgi:3-deoxy-D-manno-octulosonic-acid transferase
MQSNLDKERLLHIGGIPPEKILVVGNIKFDRVWKPMDREERESWSGSLYLKPGDRVWVAGSTHEKENEIILETFKRLKGLFPELVLIIAPRKVEEAKDAYSLSVGMGLKTLQRTDRGVYKGDSYAVMVLNSIGELGRIYGLADVSFVGGSMVPVGGHNLLEPAVFGCPVLFGVHTHNFVLMSQLIIEVGGGKRVRDAEELFDTVKELLSNKEKSRDMGVRAKEFVEKNSGALERVMKKLGEYIEAA